MNREFLKETAEEYQNKVFPENVVEKLNKHFEETPREKVLEDWEKKKSQI